MDYFILQEDRKINYRLDLRQATKKVNHLYKIKGNPNSISVDILYYPSFHVSDQVKQILEKYDPEIAFTHTMLIDSVNEKQSMYWKMKLPVVDSVQEGIVAEYPIFQWQNKFIAYLVVSLPVIESLLRRGCVGFIHQKIQKDESVRR